MTTTEARDMMTALMTLHGLHARGWHFEFDNAVKRFGCAHFTTKRVTLSRKLTQLNDRETVRLVALHEIAHVLAGHGAGHGAAWKRLCRSIGGDGQRTYGRAVKQPAMPYRAACPDPNHNHQRARLPRARYSCATTGAALNFTRNY